MRLLLSAVLILSAGCAQQSYYKIPKSAKQYIMQRQVVGYSCPKGMYLDLPSGMCQADRYSGVIELDSTTLRIDGVTQVESYDSGSINVVRE